MTGDPQDQTVSSYLKAVWRRWQKHHFAAGALACFSWAVPMFLVWMVVDWLTRMPAPGRIVLFGLLVVVSLYKAWRHGWRHLQGFNAARTALKVEEHHGEMESLLVSAVQFRETNIEEPTSRAMRELTLSKAAKVVAPLSPQSVASYKALRFPFVVVVVLALVIGTFAILNGPFLAAGIARLMPPWQAVEYPTRTQLELVSGDLVVKEGAPALIHARVSGVVPKGAEVALRTGSGDPRLHDVEIVDGVCQYPIDSAFRTFEYRIEAGDARSRWYSVEGIASPRIKRAQVSLEFPAYTQRSTEIVEALTVTVPEETQIHWELTLDRPVSEATYTSGGGSPRALTVSDDGLTVTMSDVAKESRAYNFSWVEREHAFAFTGANHYLQVAPDQRPRVEITSPAGNLYATLGRAIDLAFRARDDHGIGESRVGYRVNKIEEVGVPFTAETEGDGGAQSIDWDYRTALTNLAVGDSVSFVVEVADRYPGAGGPHRSRSQARRVNFLSKEDYLAQIARQRLRLLSQLRNLYREERAVHATLQNLDASDEIFVQTCQLEAVRQDMMGERLGALKVRIDDLLADLTANNITNETETVTLSRLSAELESVAGEHIGGAAAALRALAGASHSSQNGRVGASDAATAVHMVDQAARELALMVLQVGFNEATEVMARELHAIAETQARLRLDSILLSGEATELGNKQEQLAQWIVRLFEGVPQDRESSIDDALVAFNLSRLIKELRTAGVESKMVETAALIRDQRSGESVGLQAGVIEALLAAEFRLRIGAEREALVRAGELFESQVAALRRLRTESSSLNSEQFEQLLAGLQRKLHLLLMPAVPAARPALLDVDIAPAPPVETLLADAESAVGKTVSLVKAGDREKALEEQRTAEKAFEGLANIVSDRVDALTERSRVSSLVAGSAKYATDIGQFVERQLVLLEMTEDAAEDSVEVARVSVLEQKLADAVTQLRAGIVEADQAQAIAAKQSLALLPQLDDAIRAMLQAVPALKGNNVDDAIARQEEALEALESLTELLEYQAEGLTALASTLQADWLAQMPIPYVTDIRSEQLDLVKSVPEAKEEALPQLAIVQKNLVHAVNAVLASLDPLSHQIESGTVFLFAKEDMDAAAIALETNDLLEAKDAGSFVAESLQDLLVKLEQVTPQYTYVLEITEFIQTVVSDGMILRAAQSQLREKVLAASDEAARGELIEAQRALEIRAKNYGDLLLKAVGQERYLETPRTMSEAVGQLSSGDVDAAVEQMEIAEETLSDDIAVLVELMTHFSVLLGPPLVQPDPQVVFTLEVFALASEQKVLYRKVQSTPGPELASLASLQRDFAKRVDAFLPRSESHPKLVLAGQSMLKAASNLESSSADTAVTNQQQAGEALRHFVIEYVQEYVVPPPPPAPSDPVITDPTESFGDDFTLFMPGAVSGGKPKGGRQEWEVLGRRDRAALNENFARELPLEYRAILKDYYERLAK